MEFSSIIVAALKGGAGKTILTTGIIGVLVKQGKSIAPFKKGPDYIDAGWLALAADRPCYNLDTFLIPKESVLKSFLSRIKTGDMAVIEGNRGLYDGINMQGSTSTAELAKLLKTPVILCIDCTKTTRTMAAVVMGCIRFDADINIRGVILNRVAGSRHENILRQSIESYCGIPVLGAVPKLEKQNFPERHMGLVPTPEHKWVKGSIDAVSQIASRYLDLDKIVNIASKTLQNFLTDAPEDKINFYPVINKITINKRRINEIKQNCLNSEKIPTIGILRDSAFQFYYPENIEALEAAGAKTVFFSPLKSDKMIDVDTLYIGGGFPETHAEKLAENISFKQQIKTLADNGLPIYAECGGLMYLGKELILDGQSYPMAGVLPIVFGFSKKPQGHGYTIITVTEKNPYFAIGSEIRGHEFHYSNVLSWGRGSSKLVFHMKRGAGFTDQKDGVCYKNVLATYTHIHALGTPAWAQAIIRNAIAYSIIKKQKARTDLS